VCECVCVYVCVCVCLCACLCACVCVCVCVHFVYETTLVSWPQRTDSCSFNYFFNSILTLYTFGGNIPSHKCSLSHGCDQWSDMIWHQWSDIPCCMRSQPLWPASSQTSRPKSFFCNFVTLHLLPGCCMQHLCFIRLQMYATSLLY
jgi:hypothetical protein